MNGADNGGPRKKREARRLLISMLRPDKVGLFLYDVWKPLRGSGVGPRFASALFYCATADLLQERKQRSSPIVGCRLGAYSSRNDTCRYVTDSGLLLIEVVWSPEFIKAKTPTEDGGPHQRAQRRISPPTQNSRCVLRVAPAHR